MTTPVEKTDAVIRASDIGLYVFCARAWRLKAEGYESSNRGEMAAGTEAHAAHGQQVAVSQFTRRLSLILFVSALIVGMLMMASR